METTLNKAYPRLISTKVVSESTAVLHRKHIKKHQKHPRYLLNPTILSGTLNSSVITALKGGKKRKGRKPHQSHYKEQFGRNYTPAMEPGLSTGILHTQVKAHHCQNHLFWKGPLMVTQFLLAGSISRLSLVSWMELMQEALCVIPAPDRFNKKSTKFPYHWAWTFQSAVSAQCFWIFSSQETPTKASPDMKSPFWCSQVWCFGTLFSPACPYHSFPWN